jgi:hypothetical protein
VTYSTVETDDSCNQIKLVRIFQLQENPQRSTSPVPSTVCRKTITGKPLIV